MTTPAADAKAAIVAAFATADLVLHPFPGGPWTPPAYLLTGDTPWVQPSTLRAGSALVRWRILCIVGKPDADAAFDEVIALAETARDVLQGLAGWRAPQVAPPGLIDLRGSTYLAAIVSAEVNMT